MYTCHHCHTPPSSTAGDQDKWDGNRGTVRGRRDTHLYPLLGLKRVSHYIKSLVRYHCTSDIRLGLFYSIAFAGSTAAPLPVLCFIISRYAFDIWRYSL